MWKNILICPILKPDLVPVSASNKSQIKQIDGKPTNEMNNKRFWLDCRYKFYCITFENTIPKVDNMLILYKVVENWDKLNTI